MKRNLIGGIYPPPKLAWMTKAANRIYLELSGILLDEWAFTDENVTSAPTRHSL